ncbi:hypothetical protein NC651_016002 [Populus alba x Populus x berolinensis]|nr:hypothetical protein NC651_016002 [Populus alba x Populus x berolinensis]
MRECFILVLYILLLGSNPFNHFSSLNLSRRGLRGTVYKCYSP